MPSDVANETKSDEKPASPKRANDAADSQFVDDLVAANRLKTFLVGSGVKVDDVTVESLAELNTVFRADLEKFDVDRRESLKAGESCTIRDRSPIRADLNSWLEFMRGLSPNIKWLVAVVLAVILVWVFGRSYISQLLIKTPGASE